MGKQVVRVAKEIPFGLVILLGIWIVLWRFFTGAHMNGKKYFDTLFFKDATPIYKRKQTAFNAWKRKARFKRMIWRNAFFWTIALITYGCIVAPEIMLIVTFWASPAYVWYGFKIIRAGMCEQMTAGLADGQQEIYWTLKKQWQWLRFGWLRDELEQPVTVHTEEAPDHEDIKIISLKTLLNPGDDAEYTEGGDA